MRDESGAGAGNEERAFRFELEEVAHHHRRRCRRVHAGVQVQETAAGESMQLLRIKQFIAKHGEEIKAIQCDHIGCFLSSQWQIFVQKVAKINYDFLG